MVSVYTISLEQGGVYSDFAVDFFPGFFLIIEVVERSTMHLLTARNEEAEDINRPLRLFLLPAFWRWEGGLAADLGEMIVITQLGSDIPMSRG